MELSYSNTPLTDDKAHKILRRQLWHEAYECVKRKDAHLVDAYERILSLRLHRRIRETVPLQPQQNDIKKMNQDQRDRFLKDIIVTTLRKAENSASKDQHLGSSKATMDFLKERISSIQVAGEEVALAWVGVSLALKFLIDPKIPQDVDRGAVSMLISRMELYWHISYLLTGEIVAEMFAQYESRLIKLYTEALAWQMNFVCTFYQHQKKLLFKDIYPSKNCENMRSKLQGLQGHAWNPDYDHTSRIDSYLQSIENMAILNAIKLRDMHMGDIPAICAACGNLDPCAWDMDEFNIKNHKTHVKDVQNASIRCSACEVIITGISAIVTPLDRYAWLKMSSRKDSSLRIQYTGSGRITTNLEFYVQQDHQTPWPAIRKGRSISSLMRSERIELVSEWFNRCLKEDRVCCTQESTLPTRIIDVGSATCDPHLYQTRREQAPYTALSHCWGHYVHLTTKTADLNDRLRSIPMSALSKTFADAVLLTRELGIQYIWIDSLCIIQDDTDDWARESARMADVYQNAALNISADGAADGSQGLFQTIEISSFEKILIPFQTPTDAGLIYARETTLRPQNEYVHTIHPSYKQPLRKRGWAFQEWILSSRIAHFTTGEILWECKTLQSCECQVVSQSLTDHAEQHSRYISRQDHFKPREPKRGGGHLNWPLVVGEFVRRQVKIQSDKLPALSGLATLNKSNAAEDYIAGLWKSELPEILLWYVSSSESKRYEQYHAPSWSWASIHGKWIFLYEEPLFFISDRNTRSCLKCEIIEISTVLATKNPFGPLKSGFIRIQGLLGFMPKNTWSFSERMSKFRPNSNMTELRGLHVWHDVQEPVREITASDEIPILVIKGSRRFNLIEGLVLKRLEEEDQFMRVGFFQVFPHDKNWDSWIHDEVKAKEQIVTIF